MVPDKIGLSEDLHEKNFLIVRGFLLAFRTSPGLSDSSLLSMTIPQDADDLREWVRRPYNLRKFALQLRRSLSRLLFQQHLFFVAPSEDPVSEQAENIPVILDACADSIRDVVAILDFWSDNFDPSLVEKGESVLSEILAFRDAVPSGFRPPEKPRRKSGRPKQKVRSFRGSSRSRS